MPPPSIPGTMAPSPATESSCFDQAGQARELEVSQNPAESAEQLADKHADAADAIMNRARAENRALTDDEQTERHRLLEEAHKIRNAEQVAQNRELLKAFADPDFTRQHLRLFQMRSEHVNGNACDNQFPYGKMRFVGRSKYEKRILDVLDKPRTGDGDASRRRVKVCSGAHIPPDPWSCPPCCHPGNICLFGCYVPCVLLMHILCFPLVIKNGITKGRWSLE